MYTKNSLFALFIFFLISSATALKAQSCEHPDYAALEALYDATSGATWVDNDGWLTDCEPCNWAGVSCNGDGRVASLVLRGNALVGELPEDIGGLDQLTLLNLSYNKIGGALPAALFTSETLQDINLTGNMFSGILPATLGEQTELRNLRLSENLLSGELPATLATFLDMEILSLNNNRFSGAIPEGLGDLPVIFVLDLSENDLVGCFPEDLRAVCGQDRILFGSNPKLSWSGDFSSFCSTSTETSQFGAPCDDNDPDTRNDVITSDCGCGGAAISRNFVPVRNFTEITNGQPELELQRADAVLVAPSSPTSTTNSPNFRVFPNPVVGNQVTVQLPAGVENARLRLLELTGRVITETRAIGNSTRLALPVLESGIYLVETTTEEGRSVRRIMVN